MRLSKRAFHRLAERSLAEIPKRFLKLLYNVEIDIKDSPGPEAGRWDGSESLLGLYSGLTRADMVTPFAAAHPPARVVLYQRNIESRCATPEELERLVRTTLRHELAHHFGFTDDQLREKWPEGA